MPPLVLDPINPTVLARMLADSGIKWRVIVLSACHATGFIEPLRDDNSLIIAASGADQSQGCEAGESPSAFGQAFSQALGNTRSLPDAFSAARSAIGAKEGDASGPQMHLGRAMKDKLAALRLGPAGADATAAGDSNAASERGGVRRAARRERTEEAGQHTGRAARAPGAGGAEARRLQAPPVASTKGKLCRRSRRWGCRSAWPSVPMAGWRPRRSRRPDGPGGRSQSGWCACRTTRCR